MLTLAWSLAISHPLPPAKDQSSALLTVSAWRS